MDSLVKEVETLLTDEDYRRCTTAAMRWKLLSESGALQRLLQLLEPHLPPRTTE